MATNQFDAVVPSLPVLTGNGIFNVQQVVPNADNSFSATSANPSTSYSYPLMDPAKLIGTITAPFMNVGIPAYITTLYNNVFNINRNLQNDISAIAEDNREYPTSFAVQSYVQSQIAGVQLINNNLPQAGSPNGNTYKVVTTLNNTLISVVPIISKAFQYSYIDSLGASKTGLIALLYMDTTPNAPRVGATKTIMYADPKYLTDVEEGADYRVVLYAGDNSFFLYMGNLHKYYQFAYVGDNLSFVQAYNTVTQSWTWLVTSCMGVFSDSIDSPNEITQIKEDVPIPGSTILPKPPASTFGGLILN